MKLSSKWYKYKNPNNSEDNLNGCCHGQQFNIFTYQNAHSTKFWSNNVQILLNIKKFTLYLKITVSTNF